MHAREGLSPSAPLAVMEGRRGTFDRVPERRLGHPGCARAGSGKLVAFITGVPARLRVRSASLATAEINFLCVHKKLRHKRLAPVLIKVGRVHTLLRSAHCQDLDCMHPI